MAPDACARDARACRIAGADEIHCHPRDISGRQSLEAQTVGATIRAIRLACPGMPIGISTALGITGDHRLTLRAIVRFDVCPDYASVNLQEPGAFDVMAVLATRGIGIEAGLASVADAKRLLDLPRPAPLHRVLIEIDRDDPDAAATEAEAVLSRLGSFGPIPILLHGERDAIIWPMIALAGRLGLQTRAGFEDGLRLPCGTTAPDNAAIISAARAVVNATRAG